MNNQPQGEVGYSLVEMLVVLSLLSFITVAIASGFRFGVRVWETADTSVVRSRHVSQVHTILRQLLASAVPNPTGDYLKFEGDPSYVDFEAIAPRFVQTGGIVEVKLTIDTNSEDHTAEIKIMLSSGNNEKMRQRFAILATHVHSLAFSYLDSTGAVPTWLDRWHDRKYFPDAVRLAGNDEASRSDWPVFLAKLVVNQPPVCQFDPVSLNCRKS